MKMMINKTVDERLNFWIENSLYATKCEQINIQEESEEGVASIRCTLPPRPIYELTLEGKGFPFLKQGNCADCILLIQSCEGHWELHIIECKRTINRSKWKKVKLQFTLSIQRSMALLASIGVYPEKIKLYTAVRSQAIRDQILANPIHSKHTIRENWILLPDVEKERLHYLDWFHPSITIWLHENIPHEIIPLDENGNGTLDLHCLSEI